MAFVSVPELMRRCPIENLEHHLDFLKRRLNDLQRTRSFTDGAMTAKTVELEIKAVKAALDEHKVLRQPGSRTVQYDG